MSTLPSPYTNSNSNQRYMYIIVKYLVHVKEIVIACMGILWKILNVNVSIPAFSLYHSAVFYVIDMHCKLITSLNTYVHVQYMHFKGYQQLS